MPRSTSTPQSPNLNIGRKSRNRSQTPYNDCPVDNPDLNILSETDHQAGLCLCPLCNCGRHKCPARTDVSPYPKNMFASSYQSNYSGRKILRPQPFIKKDLSLGSKQLSFNTSYQEDYMEKPTLPDLQLSIKKKPPPSSPFLGRSQYSANFPGYPSAGVFFVKGGRSVHLSNLPFSATSSYQDTFQPMSQEEILNNKQINNNVKNLNKAQSISPKKTVLQASTTTKDAFRYSSVNRYPNQAMRYMDNLVMQKPIKNQFQSESRQQYVLYNLPQDHRKTRRVINKELNKSVM